MRILSWFWSTLAHKPNMFTLKAKNFFDFKGTLEGKTFQKEKKKLHFSTTMAEKVFGLQATIYTRLISNQTKGGTSQQL